MKLLYITMEGCGACVEKREMVYGELPEIFHDLEIQEFDLNQWEEVTALVGRDLSHNNRAPGFVMLDDDGKIMFQVIGGAGPQYIERLVRQYRLVSSFALSQTDEDSEPPPFLTVECVKGRCVL